MTLWAMHFDFFLFDLDGLLVNTEPLHFASYLDAIADFGGKANWSFEEFARSAHVGMDALKKATLSCFKAPVDFTEIRNRKQQLYKEKIASGQIHLMPGVETLLLTLKRCRIPSVIVTNSDKDQVELLQNLLLPLQTIPYVVSRQDYTHPKPNSECYELALNLYGKESKNPIGFEDSLKGFQALAQTRATPVLINPSHEKLQERYPIFQEALTFASFEDINLPDLLSIEDHH